LQIPASGTLFQPAAAALRPTKVAESIPIAIIGNFLLIAGLLFYGFSFFAQYHATGKWAKNITSLLAGMGMLTLAFALVITPRNANVIARIASTHASNVFLGVSSGLLLAAIAAFGVITYWRPLRLRHERKLRRDLSRELPKIP
jgi:ABC-type multidrug transport system permease subunit